MSETLKNPTPVEQQPSLSSAVEIPSYTQRRTFGQLLRSDLGFIPVLLTLIAIIVYFTITTNGLFLTTGNISNLLQQIIATGVGGLAVTLVLLLGEIDLSVAVVATLGAVVMGVLSERLGVPAGIAILAGLLTGTVAGTLNGFFVAYLRIPSFIVTLATSIGFSGLLLFLLAGQATLIVHDPFIVSISGSPFSFLPDIYGVGLPVLALIIYAAATLGSYFARKRTGLRTKQLYQVIGQIVLVTVIVGGVVVILENTPGPVPGTYLGVPNSAAIFFGLIIIIWLLLTKTTFGRHVYAVGGNKEAARRAGINVVLLQIIIFALCSTLAAAGGILAASRANAVTSQVSPTLLLQAIAAAVIGGVSLFGGRGSAWAVVLGALIIGSLENGLYLKSQGSDVQQMIEGTVLLLAVTIDAIVRRSQARSASGR